MTDDGGAFSQARSLLQDQSVREMIQALQSVPQELEAVRDRAQGVDHEAVRDDIDSLSDEEQDALFHQTVADLAVTAQQLREQPADGIDRLTDELRDPYTVEALLLVFENAEHIDPEYSDNLKEFVRWQLRYLGVHAVPEAYTEAEIKAVIEKFDLDYEVD